MNQEQITQAVLNEVRDFLGGPTADGDGWSFAFGEHLESNWGAVYGGALAAGTLALARAVAPDRSPRSLHLQIVRSVPSGAAYATARMRHAGRTVGTVEVDVFDARRKLAAIALVTMVTPDAVAAEYHDTSTPPFRVGAKPAPAGRDSFESPVTRALGMTPIEDGVTILLQVEDVRPSVDGSVAPGLQITVPWENLELIGPEAACLAADAAVAAPVLESFVPDDTVGPNADLSLRFTTAPATRMIMAAGTMVSAQRGTTTVAIEVRAGDQQLTHGLSTSLLLPPRSRDGGEVKHAPDGPWFNEVAEYLGPAYLRNSFTKGTEQEVEFLVEALGLEPGMRVLDVGCGPGRHALALARRGVTVHGVDLSPDFIALARESAAAEDLAVTFELLDVRELAFDSEFDAAICLCQGGFGLLGGDHEEDVIRRIGQAVRPGGMVAVSAFSTVFATRWLEDGEELDPRTGVLHEHTNVRNPEGEERVFDLWTTCFTVRELSLIAHAAGFDVVGIHGVQPGGYATTAPTVDHPELLLLARRPEAL